ncbi:hypothetical protein [Lewinella sp. LCG006]|uniref:hypothetical protein n=1 Tax=Lewinella sp. LCG006 TaxID=3231911 RepID=UPI00346038EC
MTTSAKPKLLMVEDDMIIAADNLEKVDAISEHYEFLTINARQIPISRRMKEQVINRIKMI